jgi:hypothetical protein
MVDPTRSAPATQVASDARVELSDGSSFTCPVNEIEPSERGIQIGMRFLPWHRVVRYAWDLTPEDAGSGAPLVRTRVRVILEDGSPAGEVHEVAAEQFEAGPWTLSLIAEAPAEGGWETSRRKLYVPWRSVREYERLPAGAGGSDAETPVRPARSA